MRQGDWTGQADEEFYVPFAQHAAGWDISHVAFVLRTSIDPGAVLAQAETNVRAIDPRLTISNALPMEQIIADKLWRSRLSAILLTLFAALALILAAVGIYGVISYSVGQRRQEIATRMALGAQRRDVLWCTLRESLVPVMAGVGCGLILSFAAGSWMAVLLYRVRATDPVTFGLVTVGLVVVACAATLIPTWKASAIDIVEALREQ